MNEHKYRLAERAVEYGRLLSARDILDEVNLNFKTYTVEQRKALSNARRNLETLIEELSLLNDPEITNSGS